MIKRIAASALLMFANFILMAIAVIPHHHHSQLVCIENVHCDEDGVVNNFSTSGHNHRHDADDSAECILKRVIVLPSSEEKQVFELISSTDNLFYSGLYSPVNTTYEPLILLTSLFPHSDLLFSSSINIALRLRAPPSV